MTDHAHRKGNSVFHWTVRELKGDGRAIGLLSFGVLLTVFGLVAHDSQATTTGLVILSIVVVILFAFGVIAARRGKRPDGD